MLLHQRAEFSSSWERFSANKLALLGVQLPAPWQGQHTEFSTLHRTTRMRSLQEEANLPFSWEVYCGWPSHPCSPRAWTGRTPAASGGGCQKKKSPAKHTHTHTHLDVMIFLITSTKSPHHPYLIEERRTLSLTFGLFLFRAQQGGWGISSLRGF